MQNFLSVRDIYNLVTGKPGTTLVDIRSLENFNKSHIVGAVSFIESDYASLAPNVLFEKITTQLKKQFSQTFNSSVFIADDASLKNLTKIQESFKGTKIKNVFFLETPYDVFKKTYPYICSDNFFLTAVNEYPCEILPNLFLGQMPPSRSRDITDRYFSSIGITHIVNITADSTYLVPKNVTLLQFKLNDEKYEELPLENIVEFIDKALKSNPPAPSPAVAGSSAPTPPTARVLVHCRQGISRSASSVTAYVIFAHRISVRQALTVVKTQRSVIQPIIDFLRQLYCFEDKLGIVDLENKYGDQAQIAKKGKPTPFNIRDFTHIPPAMVNMVGVFHSGSMRIYTSKKK